MKTLQKEQTLSLSQSNSLRARFHPAAASMLRQRCDDASSTVLIENSQITWKWVAAPIWRYSIVFNENSIASIIAALTLTLGVNESLDVPRKVHNKSMCVCKAQMIRWCSATYVQNLSFICSEKACFVSWSARGCWGWMPNTSCETWR